jgi:16S rRNA (guanine(966)-N(2))-methyltransferase RsmD
MLDRVREAVFSSLGERVIGAQVLDLFAGSGSLGLEALSRGAERVRFVEEGRDALQALRGNIGTLGLEESAEVLGADAFSERARAAPVGADGGWTDLVFLDPPYPMIEGELRDEVLGLAEVIGTECLGEGGVIVLHAPKGALRAEEFGAELAARERTYGSTAIWYLGG